MTSQQTNSPRPTQTKKTQANRTKYVILQNTISNKYFNRMPGPPATPLSKNTFDYFVERATRFTGDQMSETVKYDFPARCIYNELAMSLPQYRVFTLNYALRDDNNSTHRVRLVVPAFDSTYEFEYEHEKLSVAEDYAFRVFFLHSSLMKTIDSMNATSQFPIGTPLPYYEPVTPKTALHAEEKTSGNALCIPALDPNFSASVNFQSGLTGMVGENKESPTNVEDSQLISVQEIETVQPYPSVEPERIMSEDVFTDLNLAGVEWWLSRITWTPTTGITVIDLYNALFDAASSNAAIMKSFQVHALSHLKARFLIKPTANKFNVGLMGITFVPLWQLWTQEDRDAWSNKYTLSQLPHKLINACSNNEVQVDVDFSYPLEFMPHITAPSYLPSRSLGSLILFPVSPLSIGDQGTKNCDLNIFIHFESVEFAGKIDQRINMQSGLFDIVKTGLHVATSLAAGNPDPIFQSLNGVARKLINNKNADHPINPSPGSFVIPQFVPSQSTVANIEDPVNSFRLDPMGTVSHRLSPIESFSEIVQSPGLFRQITIQSTDSPRLIARWENRPFKNVTDYVLASDPNRRYVPPLGVVSSLFENYKGSIVYDIIAAMTDKHNIKLMFGVFPTPIDPGGEVDVTYLRNSKFTEINFCDGNFAASVTAPYFNPKAWSRNPSNININSDCTSASYIPSYCYLYAISSLSYSVGVSSSIELSIFERAGPDFELSVYKSPALSVTPYTAPITYPILTLQGLHWSHDLTFTNSSLAPGGRPASTDSIWNMWFNNPTSFRAFMVFFGDSPASGPGVPGYGTRRFGIAYVPLGYNDTSAVIVSILENADVPLPVVYSAVSAFAAQYNSASFNALAQYLTTFEMTSSFVYGSNNNYFHVRWTPDQPIPSVELQSGLTGNATNLSSTPGPFAPTTLRSWGVKDFGEDFSSITNLLKRPYGDVNVNIDTTRSANFPNAAMRVNVSPAVPLLNPLPINSPDYIASASSAEIVLKAFIGFRGSLILHTLFPSTPNANIWTNYFPDAYPLRDISQYPTAQVNQRLISNAPKQIFNLGINSAVRTLVPYYSPSQFVLTWTSPTRKVGDSAIISSLGSVVYGLDVNEVSSVPLTMRTVVMRAFGDDAALYLFRGFPPMIFLSNLTPVIARNSSQADIELNPGPSFSTFVHNTAESAGHGLSTGFLSGIENYFTELSRTLENTIETKLSQMGIVSSPDFSLSNVLTLLIQESGHCILSPTWKTFLWSFAIILNKLGIVGINVVPKLASSLSNWFSAIATTLSQPTTGVVVLQGPPLADPLPTDFIAILITGISTLFGIKEWKDDKNRSAKKFTDTFKSSLQLGNTLHAFIKATGAAFISIFQTAYYWLIREHPNAKTLLALTVTDSLVANWMKEVDFLTDRFHRDQITSDPSIQLRVRVAYIIGRRLHSQLIIGKDRRTSPLTYYFNQIKKLYEEFAENGFSHHIRREPFVIYVYGATCIGKSQMQSDLCARLLASESIKYDGPMVYTVPTVSPFMSGLKKQPVIAVDDLMSVIIPESLRNWFTLVFENATCATFRPNMAAIEEKEKLVENEILYFNSNHEMINHDSIPDKNAFHRRFHFKIQAEIIPELIEKHPTAKDIDSKILEKFAHLRFRRTLNPHNAANPVYGPWWTYEQLVSEAITDFKAFRLKAQESVNRRMMCELQSKSLGLADISYEQLQDENFVESKILEFLNEMDQLDNERGIFSYDFRKIMRPCSQSLTETFKKYYPKISTPVSSTINRLKSWSFNPITNSEVVTQGPSDPTPSIPVPSPQILSTYNFISELKSFVSPEFQTHFNKYRHVYSSPNSVPAFVRTVRIAEVLHNKHFSKCRCEEDYLSDDEICDANEKCFVFLHKKNLKINPPAELKSKFWYESVKSYICSKSSELWNSMSTPLKFVIGIIGTVFAGGLVKMAYNWLIAKWNKNDNQIDADFKETFLFQGHYSPGTSSKDTKKTSNIKSNVSAFTSKAVTLQSGNITDIVTKVRRNLRWITICPPEEENNPYFHRKLFPILGIRNREFFVILHYINDITMSLNQNQCVTLFDGQMHTPLSISDFHPSLLKWRYTDTSLSELGIWNAPAKVNLVSSIVVHCGSRSKLNRMNNECFIAPGSPNLDSPCVMTRFNRNDARFYDDISEYNNLISYDDYSAAGFCGSLVFSKNLACLVAIHTMGSANGKLGFGELIFREDLEDVIEVEPGYSQMELEPCTEEDIQNFPQYLKMLGKIPSHQVKKQANSSVFSLSPLANTVFEVRKEPAPLSASDPRINYEWSPMKEGVKKHSNPPSGFDPVILSLAAENSAELLKQCCSLSRTNVSVLTIEEAVLGIPDLNLKALDMSTSPGYPLSSIRKNTEKGKSYLFNIDHTSTERKLVGLHPDLSRILSTEEFSRKQGIACFSPAVDCLKDELLKIEKARRLGGTRVFSISPVQQVIAGKRLMGDWLISFRSNWFKLEHGISINPHSSDWMRLAQRLRKFPNILEGDFSNFGPQADSGVALAAIENIISWYEFNGADVDHVIQLHALKEELVNGIHLCGNYAYSTISGIISGSFATAEINSEINKIYMRIAWLSITGTDFQEFNRNVVLFTYGDDVIMSVSDQYIEQFNIRTISIFLGKHGIKFTNASKTSELVECVSLKEATFLKRGFRFDSSVPNQCLAPLDKISIEEQLNWVRNTQDPWDLITASTNSMMIEAVMWGQPYYDDLKKKLLLVFSQKDHYYPFLDYHTMVKKIYYEDAPNMYPMLALMKESIVDVEAE